MTERFLQLDRKTQAEIIDTMSVRLGFASALLEKDVWVCWALDVLFSMPGSIRMAFKGGTSLSKVFGAIHRFSEDIDVTLDYRDLDPNANPFEPGISRTMQKRIAEDLKKQVRNQVTRVVVPYFQKKIDTQFAKRGITVDCDSTGEKVDIRYGGVSADRPSYLRDNLLLEFGGRNITEPNQQHRIEPYLADSLEHLDFPVAVVDVLSPIRTFWEKATLIHAECNRNEMKAGVSRLSRHWYDLALLASNELGKQALTNREILESVVKHKKVFFHAGYADYQACLDRAFRLVPGPVMRKEMQKDYNKMVDAGMFEHEPPSFDAVLETLANLEKELNR